MSEEFKKSPDHLSIEKQLRCFYEQADEEYSIPHSYEYYEPVIHQAISMFPDSLSLQSCAAILREDTFIEDGSDVAFYHHLSYFPPIWHTNQFFVIHIVMEGEFVSYILDKEFIMKKGNICIIAPETGHALSCFSEANVVCIFIRKSTFEKAFISILRDNDSILSDFFCQIFYETNSHPFLHFQCDPDPHLMRILSIAYRESLDNNPYRNRMINNLIDNFFIMLLRNHEKDVAFEENSRAGNSANFIPMMRYIQDNYRTIKLKELAAMFNYSERQVQRILKNNLGLSFTELIQSVKMKEAANLLLKTNYTVSKIAADLGYVNMGNFREIFRKTYGKSPLEYRKSIQNMNNNGENGYNLP